MMKIRVIATLLTLGMVALVAPATSRAQTPTHPFMIVREDQYSSLRARATQEPWARHYRMYDYVVQELPALIEANFPVSDKRGISGHSMGGHGALVCALRNPGRYQSLSAFAPISNPSNCPWGEKAFSRYLGDERSRWREWDACALLAEATEKLPILVDQGDRDDFLENQLKPDALKAAAQAAGHPLTLRLQPGYDHSYYFIASFIDDHLRHHAKALLS